MTDFVIRFGGSHLNRDRSIGILCKYLEGREGRKFIVNSAWPELLKLIENTVVQVFEGVQVNRLQNHVFSFFTDIAREVPSSDYVLYTEQLVSLLKGISLIGDYSSSLKDQVISYAEKLSAEILKAKLAKTGRINSFVLCPEDIELQATADFGNATLLSVNHEKLSRFGTGLFIVPGSYGITSNGKVARTGKTAADYTSAFLVAELGVNRLDLWGLDSEFLRADPNIIESPGKIALLTYSEASELAYFDHYSFHPRTVEPLDPLHIPIVVLDSETPDANIGTTISSEAYIEKNVVKAVACSDDISLIKLDGPGVGLKPGILARVTNCLNEASINIKSVITSQISINLILERATGEKALKAIKNLGFTSVKNISLVQDVSLIGIIGHGMQESYGVSSKIFSAVAENKINVLLSGSGASNLVSYLIVKSSDKEKSVKQIYYSFFNP
jgi:aspartate kinase/aspartokinase/homoserine dehydrogenase 1